MMRIAIPTAEGRLCPHFGHCETFALLDIDETSRSILETQHLTPPPHAPGVLPVWLAEQGANVIIAGGMGQRAISMFEQNNINVVVGAPSDSPQSLVAAWLAGTLEAGSNVCDH